MGSNGCKESSLEYMFIPDFIELYGIDNCDLSIKAIEIITQFTSCEFAIRPFIIKYPEQTISIMLEWTQHANSKVRRLATEGSRPRLPWAMALPLFKKEASAIIPILEKLKDDTSEYVRRSVANNLNDISKDNPDLVIELVKKWKGVSDNRDKLVKHACRTLLKAGNTDVLEIFGFVYPDNVKIDNLSILNPSLNIGDYLNFTFDLINETKDSSLLRLEYAVYYMKANGTLSRKLYKISEKVYAGESISKIDRRQSFRLITTRRFHVGKHELAIVVNGREFCKKEFLLID